MEYNNYIVDPVHYKFIPWFTIYSINKKRMLLEADKEKLSKENFQLLLKKYAVCDDHFNGQN
jgi:hypothetical protein